MTMTTYLDASQRMGIGGTVTTQNSNISGSGYPWPERLNSTNNTYSHPTMQKGTVSPAATTPTTPSWLQQLLAGMNRPSGGGGGGGGSSTPHTPQNAIDALLKMVGAMPQGSAPQLQQLGNLPQFNYQGSNTAVPRVNTTAGMMDDPRMNGSAIAQAMRTALESAYNQDRQTLGGAFDRVDSVVGNMGNAFRGGVQTVGADQQGYGNLFKSQGFSGEGQQQVVDGMNRAAQDATRFMQDRTNFAANASDMAQGSRVAESAMGRAQGEANLLGMLAAGKLGIDTTQLKSEGDLARLVAQLRSGEETGNANRQFQQNQTNDQRGFDQAAMNWQALLGDRTANNNIVNQQAMLGYNHNQGHNQNISGMLMQLLPFLAQGGNANGLAQALGAFRA
jgi:hypothetical protein